MTVPAQRAAVWTHNDGVQPVRRTVAGGQAVDRASDYVHDKRTTGQAGRVRGPVSYDTTQAWVW